VIYAIDPAVVEHAAAAMEAADFGYELHLTKLVDGVSTYSLDYLDGSEPLEFSEIQDAHAAIAKRRRERQAVAALASALPLPPDTRDGEIAELREENRLVGEQMDRMATEIDTKDDTISALRSAVAMAKEALEPFAYLAQCYDPPENDDGDVAWDKKPKLGDLRHARSALAAIDAAEKGPTLGGPAPR
jgi:hypothetical protein